MGTALMQFARRLAPPDAARPERALPLLAPRFAAVTGARGAAFHDAADPPSATNWPATGAADARRPPAGAAAGGRQQPGTAIGAAPSSPAVGSGAVPDGALGSGARPPGDPAVTADERGSAATQTTRRRHAAMPVDAANAGRPAFAAADLGTAAPSRDGDGSRPVGAPLRSRAARSTAGIAIAVAAPASTAMAATTAAWNSADPARHAAAERQRTGQHGHALRGAPRDGQAAETSFLSDAMLAAIATRLPAPTPAAPAIQVTIERIDVRAAVAPKAPVSAAPARPRPAPSGVSLADYLRGGRST